MRSYTERLTHVVLDETEADRLNEALKEILTCVSSDLALHLPDSQLAVLRVLQAEVEP